MLLCDFLLFSRGTLWLIGDVHYTCVTSKMYENYSPKTTEKPPPGRAPTSTISWDPCFFRTAIIFIGFLIGFSPTVLVFLVVDFSTVDIYGTHLMRNLNLEFLIKI